MIHFAGVNQAPSPYSMLQYIARVATPKLVSRNCLRYLQTSLIMGGGGLVTEFMTYCLKKIVKTKGRLEKPGIFFSLNSLFLMFEICQMVLGLSGSLLDHFDPQET